MDGGVGLARSDTGAASSTRIPNRLHRSKEDNAQSEILRGLNIRQQKGRGNPAFLLPALLLPTARTPNSNVAPIGALAHRATWFAGPGCGREPPSRREI